MKYSEEKLDGNYAIMLHAVLNNFWKQHPKNASLVQPLTTLLANHKRKASKTYGYCLEKTRTN